MKRTSKICRCISIELTLSTLLVHCSTRVASAADDKDLLVMHSSRPYGSPRTVMVNCSIHTYIKSLTQLALEREGTDKSVTKRLIRGTDDVTCTRKEVRGTCFTNGPSVTLSLVDTVSETIQICYICTATFHKVGVVSRNESRHCIPGLPATTDKALDSTHSSGSPSYNVFEVLAMIAFIALVVGAVVCCGRDIFKAKSCKGRRRKVRFTRRKDGDVHEPLADGNADAGPGDAGRNEADVGADSSPNTGHRQAAVSATEEGTTPAGPPDSGGQNALGHSHVIISD